MLALVGGRVAAQDRTSLAEITVEANPFDVALPARTTVSREAILDANKSELSDQLDLTPGVNVRDGGRGEPRIDLRGFDQRAILFTLDGVPMYEPYNGVINIDLFPLEMLERIDISRGASSALDGPNGLAGSIALRSLRASAPLTASTGLIWRDSDFWDARVSATGVRGEVSGTLAGRYLTSPGFSLSDDFADRPPTARRLENGGLRLNSDSEEMSLFASSRWEYAPTGHLYGAFLGSTGSFGIPPSTTQFLPILRRNSGQTLTHGHLGGEQQLGAVGVSSSLFYTGYQSDETQFTAPDFATEILTTRADAHELGALARTTIDLVPSDSLAAAVQVRQDWATVSDDVNGRLSDPRFTTVSVAGENLWLPDERIAVVLGLSLDLQTGNRRGTAFEPNPQLGVSADWQQWGTTRAAAGRKARFPTLRELSDPLQGNADLAPETAWVYELGHTVHFAEYALALNLFRSDVDDLIAGAGGDNMQFENLQHAVQQGVEVVGVAQPIDWLRLDLNYTYLDARARDRTTGGDYAIIQHKPANRFNGIATFGLPYDVALRLEGLYASEAVDIFGSDVVTAGFGQFNSQLSWTWRGALRVFAGVDNLLDDDHEEQLGNPQPGRWASVGFRATY